MRYGSLPSNWRSSFDDSEKQTIFNIPQQQINETTATIPVPTINNTTNIPQNHFYSNYFSNLPRLPNILARNDFINIPKRLFRSSSLGCTFPNPNFETIKHITNPIINFIHQTPYLSFINPTSYNNPEIITSSINNFSNPLTHPFQPIYQPTSEPSLLLSSGTPIPPPLTYTPHTLFPSNIIQYPEHNAFLQSHIFNIPTANGYNLNISKDSLIKLSQNLSHDSLVNSVPITSTSPRPSILKKPKSNQYKIRKSISNDDYTFNDYYPKKYRNGYFCKCQQKFNSESNIRQTYVGPMVDNMHPLSHTHSIVTDDKIINIVYDSDVGWKSKSVKAIYKKSKNDNKNDTKNQERNKLSLKLRKSYSTNQYDNKNSINEINYSQNENSNSNYNENKYFDSLFQANDEKMMKSNQKQNHYEQQNEINNSQNHNNSNTAISKSKYNNDEYDNNDKLVLDDYDNNRHSHSNANNASSSFFANNPNNDVAQSSSSSSYYKRRSLKQNSNNHYSNNDDNNSEYDIRDRVVKIPSNDSGSGGFGDSRDSNKINDRDRDRNQHHQHQHQQQQQDNIEIKSDAFSRSMSNAEGTPEDKIGKIDFFFNFFYFK